MSMKMPIYLQAVREVTASQSGVLILPLVIGQIVFLALGGSITTIWGYYNPTMLIGSILAPIGAGLLTTLAVDASLRQIIVYQLLLGIACGIGWQGPQLAAQAVLNPKDSSMGIASIIFAQNLGPAIFVSVSQTIFTERLKADLQIYAPGLNATSLQNMGLQNLKTSIGKENLQGALLGYDKAIVQTFYLAVALAAASFLGASGMEWRSVKRKVA